MNNKTDPTETLFCWSLQASRNPLPDTLPVGFATRVLADCVRKAPQTPWWEYLALRSAVAGCVIACGCWILHPTKPPVNEDEALAFSLIQTSLLP